MSKEALRSFRFVLADVAPRILSSVLHVDAHAHLEPRLGLGVDLLDARFEDVLVTVERHEGELLVLAVGNVAQFPLLVAQLDCVGISAFQVRAAIGFPETVRLLPRIMDCKAKHAKQSPDSGGGWP